jgi:hypothetical protein
VDITNAKVREPNTAIKFAPIFWEPYIGSGEKIVALLVVAPNLNSSSLVGPKCYCVLSEKRLVAMLGRSKGNSARAILAQSAEYLTTRLQAGLDLSEAVPPFYGFSVGAVRASSGYTSKQTLDAAVRSVSAFGDVEEIFPDDPEIARHSTTTREFLSKVRKSAFGVRARERFNKRMKVSLIDENSPEVIIDYCHEKLIVQATSLPLNNYQRTDLRKEADSKFFEIYNLRKHTEKNQWDTKLLLNTEALRTPVDAQSHEIALRAQSDIEYFAKTEGVELVCVESANAAIAKLESLDQA